MSLTPIEASRNVSYGRDRKACKPFHDAPLLGFLSWEIYLIVIVAGFLRLYGIDTTEFDDDQAAVFRMAHDAVSHGLLVATSNIASIHIYNPPAIIYFFMLPAVFSADPLGGAVMVGVLMTLSVLLTYIFVRRYYGRGAANCCRAALCGSRTTHLLLTFHMESESASYPYYTFPIRALLGSGGAQKRLVSSCPFFTRYTCSTSCLRHYDGIPFRSSTAPCPQDATLA